MNTDEYTILNLDDLEASEIRFEKILYKDGQPSIRINPVDSQINGNRFLILSRVNSSLDLMYVLLANNALRGILGTKADVSLFMPCFFGMRSDRKFDQGGSFDLKVITQLVNSCGFSKVFTLRPHSDVLGALVENLEVISDVPFVRNVLRFIGRDTVLVSPDAGAYKYVAYLGEQLGLTTVPANKIRIKGSPQVVIQGNVNGRRCLIVDDYCDGGRTFEALAEKLNEAGAYGVYLYVTHGLFSNGRVLKGIDRSFSTDSIHYGKDGFFDIMSLVTPNLEQE